jgi:hypothetical protein
MNHRTVKGWLLALAIVLPGAALANEPAAGSTESYSGSLAELATGVRSTPTQPTTIQSPRDPASGQATARNAPTSTGDQPEMTLRNSAGGQQGQIMQDYYAHSNVVSPRDAASGQATSDGSNNRSVNPSQSDSFSLSSSSPGSTLVNNENLTSARGTETANTGQWIGGSDDGQSIRKPRPNKRPRKGRRMHKP